MRYIHMIRYIQKIKLYCVKFIIFFLTAFSWFSFCEYVIASANMGFHVTVILDFPKEQLVVGNGLPASKVD